MGVGTGKGDNRAEEAAKQAISSPLLETSIKGATGVLINVTGGSDLGLLEISEAAEIVQDAADPDAHIIFGAVINESMKDEIRITVIATGFDEANSINKEKPSLFGKPERKEEVEETKTVQEEVAATSTSSERDDIDIPTFLRKRHRF